MCLLCKNIHFKSDLFWPAHATWPRERQVKLNNVIGPNCYHYWYPLPIWPITMCRMICLWLLLSMTFCELTFTLNLLSMTFAHVDMLYPSAHGDEFSKSDGHLWISGLDWPHLARLGHTVPVCDQRQKGTSKRWIMTNFLLRLNR